MEIASPFTPEELYVGYNNYVKRLGIERGGRPSGKPSISGLGDCARQQAALIAGIPREGGESRDSAVTTEQGRMMEDLTCGAIASLPEGVVVVNRQVCIGHPVCHPDNIQGPDYEYANGHPDGELADKAGLLAGHYTFRGERWGFEHKHIGRYGYKQILQKGFRVAEPAYMAQTLGYGDALGWDKVFVVVMGQDASSNRFEIRTGKGINKDADPKILMYAFDVKQMAPLIPMLRKRANEMMAGAEDPANVAREYDGKLTFPCNYCSVQKWCNSVGDGGTLTTPPPFGLIK